MPDMDIYKHRVIVVWGQNGSGKTTFAAALAISLAQGIHGKGSENSVLLVNSDPLTPAVSEWLKKSESANIPSLGEVLNYPNITSEYLFEIDEKKDPKRIIFFDKWLALMSYTLDTRLERYDAIEPDAAQGFISTARSQIDYLIIDGTSNPNYDALTRAGLKSQDDDSFVITLVRPTTGGCGFIKSLGKWIENKPPHHLVLASPVEMSSGISSLENAAGIELFATLPFTQEARQKGNECNLFSEYKGKYQEPVRHIATFIEEVKKC